MLLAAVGSSGMDGTVYDEQEDGYTAVKLQGKLYLDTLEGTLRQLRGGMGEMHIWVLDAFGNRLRELAPGDEENNSYTMFEFTGEDACGCYEITVE